MKKFFLIISLLALIQCGFEPIYSDKNNRIESDYKPILISENSNIIKETFKSVFNNENSTSNFELRISIQEEDQPVITNSDGTIAKYRIDISTSFILFDVDNKLDIFSDYSRGFAQYETQINNYDTEQKRDEARKIATMNSLQVIPIKIQNFQSRDTK